MKRKGILLLLIFSLSLTALTVLLSNYTFLVYSQQASSNTPAKNTTADSFSEKERELLNMIEKQYLNDFEIKDIENGKLKGMVEALKDPYSIYLTDEEMNDLYVSMEGEFGGIGIVVSPHEDGFITVVSPIDDTPAYKAGIKTGDKILKVNGDEYFSDTMDSAVNNMRGEPGTEVTITVKRTNSTDGIEVFDLTITRDIIKIESVKASVIKENIGYLRVTSFDDNTDEVFEEELKKLIEKNIAGLVIDLRNNPGGLLDVSLEMADMFLDEGILLVTMDKNNNENIYNADEDYVEVPLVVIVNEGSASASEIFTAAMKDNGRAFIIGTKTFGKGIIQSIYPFMDGSGVKLTTMEYFSPDGNTIHGEGITPDLIIDLNEETEGIGPDYIETDNQLLEAIDRLKP